MNYYYLDSSNQPAGPLPLDEIRQKAARGEVPAHPMVAALGSSQWQPLPAAGAAPAASPEGFQFDHVLSDAASSVVHGARGVLSSALLEDSLDLARRAGHFIVVAGGVLGLAYALYAAIRAGVNPPPTEPNNPDLYQFASASPSITSVLVSALLLLVGLAFAQFAARRFFPANEKLLTRSRVSSAALLECIALLALLIAFSAVVTAVMVWIRFGAWQSFAPAVLAALFWTALGAIALHPESVNVEVGPAGVGEQVVGLLTFFCKVLLKLVPLFFITLAALGSLVIVQSFFDQSGIVLGLLGENLARLLWALGRDHAGFAGVWAIVVACLLPVLAHLLFIAVSLPLDLWRSILSVPEKLDALKH